MNRRNAVTTVTLLAVASIFVVLGWSGRLAAAWDALTYEKPDPEVIPVSPQPGPAPSPEPSTGNTPEPGSETPADAVPPTDRPTRPIGADGGCDEGWLPMRDPNGVAWCVPGYDIPIHEGEGWVRLGAGTTTIAPTGGWIVTTKQGGYL